MSVKKYRKKPVVIEAMQLTRENVAQVSSWIGESMPSFLEQSQPYDEGIYIKTLESDGETQLASWEDVVIKGIQGEFYPCKPDIFEATYEEV